MNSIKFKQKEVCLKNNPHLSSYNCLRTFTVVVRKYHVCNWEHSGLKWFSKMARLKNLTWFLVKTKWQLLYIRILDFHDSLDKIHWQLTKTSELYCASLKFAFSAWCFVCAMAWSLSSNEQCNHSSSSPTSSRELNIGSWQLRSRLLRYFALQFIEMWYAVVLAPGAEYKKTDASMKGFCGLWPGLQMTQRR